jgi:putative membrane protein
MDAFQTCERRKVSLMHDHHNHHQHQSPVDSGPGSFSDLWNPEIMLLVLLLAILYFLVTGPLRYRFSDATPATGKQKALFVLAMVVLYAAAGSPINYFGHHFLFSAHMLQMALLFIALPPLLMVGVPSWLWAVIFRNKLLLALMRVFAQPLVAALVFNTLLSFYHVPFILDFAARDHDWMNAIHALLFLAAFCMWWPIVNPLPGQEQQLAGLRKIGYLFANSILITPACALIIFANEPLYQNFMNAPRVFPGLDAFADQRLGGIIMKLIQEVVYGSVLSHIFYKWYKNEKENDLPMDRQPGQTDLGLLEPALADNKNRV